MTDNDKPIKVLEVLRYHRGTATRIYSLRTVTKGAELWRVTEEAGEQAISFKECDLTNLDEAVEFLDEVRRSLTAGGWQEV